MKNADILYPVGRQVFSEIRELGMMYVDKTELVYKMTHMSSKYIFLSRPRRFGKTLLVDTLQCYFEGQSALFHGLAMERLEQEWNAYPVLRFNMNEGKHLTSEGLRRMLLGIVSRHESAYGLQADSPDVNLRLVNLVQHIYRQTGKQVVVLIDEYDAQLLDVIHDEGQLVDVRNAMRNFYAPLKPLEPYLRFVFLTGITKFSQLSIFSELNNIRDISMSPDYAALCGITQQELLTQLQSGIEGYAQKWRLNYDEAVQQLKTTYDGYHFTMPSPDIYNPFSLLATFDEANDRKEAYWFESGTPTYVVELLRKYNVVPEDLSLQKANREDFDVPPELVDDCIPMLYQSGYLTIKGYDPEDETYLLGIPNGEVRQGLMKNLLLNYVQTDQSKKGRQIAKRVNSLMHSDKVDDALRVIQTFLQTIPQTKNAKSEGHYQSLLYVIFTLAGFVDTRIEETTVDGRLDMAIFTAKRIYLLELKINRSGETAMRQITEKNYAARYANQPLPITQIGVNFSTKTRTLTDDWIIKPYES